MDEEKSNWGGVRPGAGRPTPPGMPPGGRRKTRSIKFSDTEWEQITAAAKLKKISAAEYIRRKVLLLNANPPKNEF